MVVGQLQAILDDGYVVVPTETALDDYTIGKLDKVNDTLGAQQGEFINTKLPISCTIFVTGLRTL